MRGWLRDYRKGGFEALRPKPRADQGQARAIPQEVTDLLCTIKEDSAGWATRRAGYPHTALTWYIEGFELSPFDEVLLTNATAAAIESGNVTQAMEMLQLLAKHHPKSQVIPTLVNILARFCQEDGPPPVVEQCRFRTMALERARNRASVTAYCWLRGKHQHELSAAGAIQTVRRSTAVRGRRGGG